MTKLSTRISETTVRGHSRIHTLVRLRCVTWSTNHIHSYHDPNRAVVPSKSPPHILPPSTLVDSIQHNSIKFLPSKEFIG